VAALAGHALFRIGDSGCNNVRDYPAEMINVFPAVGVYAIAQEDDKSVSRRMHPKRSAGESGVSEAFPEKISAG